MARVGQWAIYIGDPIIKREGWVQLIGLTPPHLCACLKESSGLST
jgi:hypothetical protein